MLFELLTDYFSEYIDENLWRLSFELRYLYQRNLLLSLYFNIFHEIQ